MTSPRKKATITPMKVPYVMPGMLFVWDLANTSGAYLAFRLAGDIRIYRDVLSMQPYVLLLQRCDGGTEGDQSRQRGVG